MNRVHRTALIAIALLVAALVVTPPAASAAESISYDVEIEGSVAADAGYFAEIARLTLSDDRGWNLGGTLDFGEVSSDGDFDLVLASPEVVADAAPGCSRQYSCTVGDEVYINDDNFREATASWRDTGRSIRDYRSYVIVHEVGHWLGLDHTDDCGRDRFAPVMLQQSISLEGCRANVWPLGDEREAVAARFGEEILTGDRFPSPLELATLSGDWDGDGQDEPGAFDAGRFWLSMEVDADGEVQQLDYGRAGDIPVVGDWDGDGDDTLGVVRGNTFILRNDYSPPHDDLVLEYGRDDDLPVVGDWDGDGTDTIGVVRGNEWILRNHYSGDKEDLVLHYGFQVDSPVAGDWDGDQDETLGIVRNASDWVLRNQYHQPYGDVAFTWTPRG